MKKGRFWKKMAILMAAAMTVELSFAVPVSYAASAREAVSEALSENGMWYRANTAEYDAEVFSQNGLNKETKQAESTDGISFTDCFSCKSGSLSGKYIKLIVPEKAHLVLYCRSSGKERSMILASEDGEIIKDIPAVEQNDPMAPSLPVDLEAGTYYLYAQGGTVYTFGLHLIPGAAPARKAWSKVADPVIENVVREENGSLTVKYSADIGYDGADLVRIFLFQNGFEVECVDKRVNVPVTLTPITNGDFVIRALLLREDEADKTSADYKIDGYKLPPSVPAITWLNNLGDGKVYVDWNNVDADQGCDVYYKVKGEGDDGYILAEENCKDGKCTLEGLASGTEYDVKVVAKDSTLGDSKYERSVKVRDPEQEWYVDCFGVVEKPGTIRINDGEEFKINAYDGNFPVSINHVEDITDGSGSISMATESGKIADSEEGMLIYYTRMNPNTENFKLSGTFSVNEGSKMDNQTGFGVYALDIAGLGTPDARYMNSVGVGSFKLDNGEPHYHGFGVRTVTGYESYDPANNFGVERNLDNKYVFKNSPLHGAEIPAAGSEYTFTLEKTNDGFLCTYDGETITIPGVKRIMVQENGSMIVGLVIGRGSGTIKDIHFDKTEGSVGADAVEDPAALKVDVYSSEISSKPTYTFIAGSNVDGEFTLSGNGKKIAKTKVGPSKVADIDVPLWRLDGKPNALTYSFKPDKDTPDLSSYDEIKGSLSVVYPPGERKVLYTSPGALESGKGTKENPCDLQILLNKAKPGQVILMMDGTYAPKEQLLIPRSVSGAEEDLITLMPEHAGKVKIDGGDISSGSILQIVGSYWHIYGIEFFDTISADRDESSNIKGVSVSGNYNTVELCKIHDVGNSGLQISRFTDEPNLQDLWPSHNLIKNCDSWNCCDPTMNDADGFAAKLTCGEGNKFYGCISHHNIDDGWDLYAKSTIGKIGAVTIENCVAYRNGFLLTEDPELKEARGEGNGFKLGGENMYGGHVLRNSVSFNNYARGISSNSCPDCEIYDCTVYNNVIDKDGDACNICLYTRESNVKGWIVDGTISLVTEGSCAKAEIGDSYGVIKSLRNSTNYFYNGRKSANNQGIAAAEDWFENVDMSIAPNRNADGTINMHGLLVLKENAPKDTGARLDTSCSLLH